MMDDDEIEFKRWRICNQINQHVHLTLFPTLPPSNTMQIISLGAIYKSVTPRIFEGTDLVHFWNLHWMIFSFLFKNKISDIHIFLFIKEISKLLDCIQRSMKWKFLVIGRPRYLIGWKRECRRCWKFLPHTGRKAHFFLLFPLCGNILSYSTVFGAPSEF